MMRWNDVGPIPRGFRGRLFEKSGPLAWIEDGYAMNIDRSEQRADLVRSLDLDHSAGTRPIPQRPGEGRLL
jgi:hypothetical protein